MQLLVSGVWSTQYSVLLSNVSHANYPPSPPLIAPRSYLSVFHRISLLRSLLKGDCMQGLTIFLGRISPFSSLAVSVGRWHCAVLVIVCN